MRSHAIRVGAALLLASGLSGTAACAAHPAPPAGAAAASPSDPASGAQQSAAPHAGHLVAAHAATYAQAVPEAVAPAAEGGVWISEGSNGHIAHAAANGTMTDIVLPKGTSAGAMTLTSDGSLWYADAAHDVLAQLPQTGSPRVYPLPHGTHPSALALGPDGSMWFTASGTGDVGRLNPATGGIGMLGHWPTHFQPEGIAIDKSGTVWITDTGNDAIVRLHNGSRTTFPVPAPRGHPTDIVLGDDGNLWFAAVDVDGLARITPSSGRIAWVPLDSPGGRPKDSSTPFHLVAAPDGIWATESGNDNVLRLAPDGTQTNFPVGNEPAAPDGIARASDGRIWFTERNADLAARIGPDGKIADFSMPRAPSSIDAIRPIGIRPAQGGGFWLRGEDGIIGILKPDGSFAPVATIPAGPGSAYDGYEVAPNGDFWVSESYTNSFADIAADGTVHQVNAPDASDAFSIAPDGAVWFAQKRLWKIGKLAPDGTLSEYPVEPVKYGSLWQIVARPDGSVHFVILGGEDVLESIDSNGTLREEQRFRSNNPGLVAAADGALWYQELVPASAPGSYLPVLTRLASDGQIRHYPAASDAPLEPGADGSVWFSLIPGEDRATVGHVTPEGRIQKFVLPSHTSPGGFALDTNGDMWFVESDSFPNTIAEPTLGKITLNGDVSEYRIVPDR